MNNTVLYTLSIALLLNLSFCQNKIEKGADIATQTDLKTLETALHKQVECWNNNDLKGYMSYYWKSDSLKFITKNKITKGWDSIFKSYQNSFPNLDDVGKLKFSNLDMCLISSDLAQATGNWHIERPKGNIGGNFSLICRFRNNQWEIIIDHTW